MEPKPRGLQLANRPWCRSSARLPIPTRVVAEAYVVQSRPAFCTPRAARAGIVER